MNYKKLDAALSAALSEQPHSDEPSLVVSVRTLTPPDKAQQQEMEQLGVRGVSSRGKIFSAQLSPQAVSELSDKPWVRLLSLSTQLKPL